MNYERITVRCPHCGSDEIQGKKTVERWDRVNFMSNGSGVAELDESWHEDEDEGAEEVEDETMYEELRCKQCKTRMSWAQVERGGAVEEEDEDEEAEAGAVG